MFLVNLNTLEMIHVQRGVSDAYFLVKRKNAAPHVNGNKTSPRTGSLFENS